MCGNPPRLTVSSALCKNQFLLCVFFCLFGEAKQSNHCTDLNRTRIKFFEGVLLTNTFLIYVAVQQSEAVYVLSKKKKKE